MENIDSSSILLVPRHLILFLHRVTEAGDVPFNSTAYMCLQICIFMQNTLQQIKYDVSL